jgi:UDP-N-acetylmuramate--alanine ligase
MISKEHYHFIGLGGAGMSALARIYAGIGIKVSGSDIKDSSTLRSLSKEHDITTFVGHRAGNIEGATLVIATAAVRGANPEVDRAVELGIPVISRADMLGRLMSNYSLGIAVSGTHGKTTTSAMIAQMLEAADADPTAVIGGDIPDWASNARIGKSEVFVAEACEAYGSFLSLSPSITVVTNVEPDHLDHYHDMDAIREAFRTLLRQTEFYAVLCGDDPEASSLAKEFKGNVATYGLTDGCSVHGRVISLGAGSRFEIDTLGYPLGEVELMVPGKHNVVNALAAVTVGNLLDIPFEKIAAGLKAFRGTGRRFEILGTTDSDIVVVDDYAHHPTEIRATLEAAASSYPDRRIIAVFQPHLPSRTRDLMDEFAACFHGADLVLLTDIFLSREQPLPGVTGDMLAYKMMDVRGKAAVEYIPDKNDIPGELRKYARPHDLIITLGAGDIRVAGETFLEMVGAAGERVVNV